MEGLQVFEGLRSSGLSCHNGAHLPAEKLARVESKIRDLRKVSRDLAKGQRRFEERTRASGAPERGAPGSAVCFLDAQLHGCPMVRAIASVQLLLVKLRFHSLLVQHRACTPSAFFNDLRMNRGPFTISITSFIAVILNGK